MKQRMFARLFSKQMALWQRLLVVFSAFAGMLLLWVPLQCFFDIRDAMQAKEELFGDHYLVLNKEVSVFKALGGSPDTFSDNEIEALRSQGGVEAVGSFLANSFRAMASADYNGAPMFRTDMFFEAVPDNFLDTRPRGWNWKPDDEDVPIIIPSDYLALYNFGYAPGQGLPQISNELAKMSAFTIVVSGRGQQTTFKARIAGFSDRINTILAPIKFIEHCNGLYGEGTPKAPSRVIVRTQDAQALEKWMKENGYETSQEALNAGKTQQIAERVLAMAMAVAALIVLLSLGSFIQLADLLVARSDAEIKTLAWTGHSPAKITRWMFRQIALPVIISMAVALVAGFGIRRLLLDKLSALIEQPSLLPSTSAFVLFVLIMAVYFALVFFNLRRRILQQVKAF